MSIRNYFQKSSGRNSNSNDGEDLAPRDESAVPTAESAPPILSTKRTSDSGSSRGEIGHGKVPRISEGGPAYHMVAGDICSVPAGVAIVHQCNCVSKGARGLAKLLYARFPYCNVYDGSVPRSTGQICIRRPEGGATGPPVVAMFAQFVPGKCNARDTPAQRKRWFQTCLDLLLQELQPGGHLENSEIAFPFQIGCGLAGGNWRGDYEPMVARFARQCPSKVYVYKFDG